MAASHWLGCGSFSLVGFVAGQEENLHCSCRVMESKCLLNGAYKVMNDMCDTCIRAPTSSLPDCILNEVFLYSFSLPIPP